MRGRRAAGKKKEDKRDSSLIQGNRESKTRRQVSQRRNWTGRKLRGKGGNKGGQT